MAIQNAISQGITFTDLPKNYQLYPRNDLDVASVDVAGTVDTTGYDSIIIEIDRSSNLWDRFAQHLNGQTPFSFTTSINAELANYDFYVILKRIAPPTEDTVATATNVVCGDVYLINGQSNAVAAGTGGGDKRHTFVRSFGNSTNQDTNAAKNTSWDLAGKGKYGTQDIGQWGIRLGRSIADSNGVPVCIIQQGEGNQNITYFIDGIGGSIDLDKNYDRLLYRAQNAGVVNDVKAIFWWQGENDAVSQSNVNSYESNFLALYEAWKSDYPNLAKVYTTQIHPGYGAYCDQLREVQRKIAEDSTDIEIITPHNIGGFDGVHFLTSGYLNFGSKLYQLVARDFYNSANTIDINPPNIQQAYFVDNGNKDILILEFDNTNPLMIGSGGYSVKDHFYFHNNNSTIDTAFVNNIMVYTNKLRLELKSTSNADSLSFIPAQYYNESTTIYDGPWLENSNGVSALTFYKFPIIGTGDDPLPVTLSVFSAEFLNGTIKLKWRTESEINNLGFVLLRKSGNQQDYQQIAGYDHNEALQGQGTTPQATDYEFTDTGITEGGTYSYLLVDVDYNGNKETHGPISVTAAPEALPGRYNLYQNYPNPFNPVTRIAFFLPRERNVRLRVFDVLGREVEVLLDDKLEPGYHEIPFNAEELKSGAYFYEIRTLDYHAVRKMVLTK